MIRELVNAAAVALAADVYITALEEPDIIMGQWAALPGPIEYHIHTTLGATVHVWIRVEDWTAPRPNARARYYTIDGEGATLGAAIRALGYPRCPWNPPAPLPMFPND